MSRLRRRAGTQAAHHSTRVKLLFDQNLSHRLVASLADLYPGSVHVREIELRDADDDAVWDYARTHGLVIISKDLDFHQRSLVFGHPPKVVWVRLGNCSTEQIEALLRRRHQALLGFEQNQEAAFLAVA